MRTEKEMLDLILGFAKQEVQIRAVILNGSRVNPNVPKDDYRDFDIVYLVTDKEEFTRNLSWTEPFGKKLVFQTPDDSKFYPSEERTGYGILLQFTDGNRIDFTIDTIDHYAPYCLETSLSKILLDKDGVLPSIPEPDESTHYVKAPTQASFDACRCEFWWVSTYISKGLNRHQLLYAEHHMEYCIRKELMKMLSWYAVIEHGTEFSIGKCGDRIAPYIGEDLWNKYLSTYCILKEEDLWKSLRAATDLFTEVSSKVAEHFGFRMEDLLGNPDTWDESVPKYLFG